MFVVKEEMKLKYCGNKIFVFIVLLQKKYYRNLIELISVQNLIYNLVKWIEYYVLIIF